MQQERQYVGIDLHRRRSVIVRMTPEGEKLDLVRIEKDPVALALEIAKAGPEPEVVLEACYGWYWASDVLEACGARVHLAHPLGNNWGHRRVKVAAALDPVGGLIGVEEFGTTTAGYEGLLVWLSGFGPVLRVGVEGTGSYGAGLARFLLDHGVEVVEVDRPNRQERARKGKSDPVDAIEAVRAAQSGRASGRAKTRDGAVEAMRALLVVKRSARNQRTASLVQMRHLVFTAPDDIRARFFGLAGVQLVAQAAALRPREGGDLIGHATKVALRQLARRVQGLSAEITEARRLLRPLVEATAPGLLALYGVGIEVAAVLLVAAGDNPTEAGTARRTTHCSASWSPAWAPTLAPSATSSGAGRRESPPPRSYGCSSVT